VFDRVELFNRSRGRPKIGYWLDWNAPSERIDALLAHATTSPEVYHIRDGWFLLCAMNDQAILLQKSASGKPEGPYEDFTVLATRGGYPSLFIDDDMSVYLVPTATFRVLYCFVRILASYFDYYHSCRPHLSLGRNSPTPRDVEPPSQRNVIAIPKVGSLHHCYTRAA
jgi:hypothetical protein